MKKSVSFKPAVINRFATIVLLASWGLFGVVANLPTAQALVSQTEDITAEIMGILSLSVVLPTSNSPGDIQMTPNGAVATGELDVWLTSYNSTGASLSLSMVATDTTGGDLASGGGAAIKRLGTASAGVFGVNEWGAYDFDISSLVDDAYDINTADVSSLRPSSPTWYGVPDFNSGKSIWSAGNFATAGKKVSRGVFGAKVDFGLPAGGYSNSVIYTASANPVP